MIGNPSLEEVYKMTTKRICAICHRPICRNPQRIVGIFPSGTRAVYVHRGCKQKCEGTGKEG